MAQEYYTWLATDPLCRWLRHFAQTSHTYVAAFGSRCTAVNRHRGAAPAIRRVGLEPIHYYARTMSERRFWPNSGRSFPAEFYERPPGFVVLLHVLLDAVITPHGHVIGRGVHSSAVKLTRYSCKAGADVSTAMPDGTSESVVYGRVLAVAMISGEAYYHRLLEQIPRVAPYVDFLRRNPDVRIHVMDVDPLTVGLLQVLGIDDAGGRAVSGLVHAGVVYVPRFAECLWPRPVDVQLAAHAFHRYIRRHILRPPSAVRRDRVVMVRRTKRHRKLHNQDQIEALVQRAAADFGLRFSLFIDNPPPTLNETMTMFHEAVLVVAPHGAGLANIVFSVPGTAVVEVRDWMPTSCRVKLKLKLDKKMV